MEHVLKWDIIGIDRCVLTQGGYYSGACFETRDIIGIDRCVLTQGGYYSGACFETRDIIGIVLVS